MMSQDLITRYEGGASGIDYECPDCQSLLTVFYDNMRRYMCENCNHEISAKELDDNNISNGFEDKSNRRLF